MPPGVASDLRFTSLMGLAIDHTNSLDITLDKLARLEPDGAPFVSLYLNLQADAHGKDNYAGFVRKELPARARTFPEGSAERDSIDRDHARIQEYLDAGVPPSANGLAIFASSGRDNLFEALVLEIPIEQNRLSIAPSPLLYPLALLVDRNPRHAVVHADSHVARIFVFDSGKVTSAAVTGEKIRRSSGGGWAQARYQRHVEKLQSEHARELVETLERVVREDGIDHVILAGDEVNIPLVRSELSKELAAKVIDVLKLEARAPEHEVMAAAADALNRHDDKTDEEVVARTLDEYRAGGLATAGYENTLEALTNGQVDELYLTTPGPSADEREGTVNELIGMARRTSASTRFIEDTGLLASVGGVAASLRFRLRPRESPAG